MDYKCDKNFKNYINKWSGITKSDKFRLRDYRARQIITKWYSASPSSIINTVFTLNSDSYYNLRQISQFSRSLVRLIYYGTKSISYLCPKIWDILLDDYKILANLDTFHCAKSVHIQSYSGPRFPAFGLNTERYSVSLCI